MYKDIIAIIPARGGSVGIPRKNIIDFCGKPLLAWSIEQALEVSSIKSVWVTSDNEEILSIAEKHGAQPITRPADLSDSEASSESAWLHALNFIESRGVNIDLIVAMQATSPLREPKDIMEAIAQFQLQKCDSLFSASVLEDFLIWQNDESGDLHSINYDYQARKRRQSRHLEYLENGSFYLFKPENLKKFNNRLSGKIGTTPMPFWKSFEIDTPEDLWLCELLFKEKRLDKNGET